MSDLAGSEKEVDLSQGPIFIGYYKPIKNFYVELVEELDDDEINVQYFNGESFVDVAFLEDNTFGLTKSGLIRFKEIEKDFFKKSEINGLSKYWLKITNSSESTPLLKGINLVLSNDKDLSFVPSLTSYLPNGADSWIAFHQEATSQVIQTIRNSGKTIRYDKNGIGKAFNIKQVDQFDLLDIEEFRNASKYYALYLIFDYISKGDGDSYHQKSVRYFEKYVENLNDKLISLDENDNGVKELEEELAVQFIRLRRE
jgi:hypothetical protein